MAYPGMLDYLTLPDLNPFEDQPRGFYRLANGAPSDTFVLVTFRRMDNKCPVAGLVYNYTRLAPTGDIDLSTDRTVTMLLTHALSVLVNIPKQSGIEWVLTAQSPKSKKVRSGAEMPELPANNPLWI